MSFEEPSESEQSLMPDELRLEMKIKNNVLWTAIHSRARSVLAFCESQADLTHSDYCRLCQLLSFKISPYKAQVIGKHGVVSEKEYRNVCLKLQKIIGLPAEYLFPDELYEKFVGTETAKAITVSSLAALPASAEKEFLALPDPNSDIIEQLNTVELRERVADLLKTLPGRYQQVIKLRYGIPDGATHTLDQVGDILGIHQEQVRQMEVKALNKLRGPFRADRLKSFVDG